MYASMCSTGVLVHCVAAVNAEHHVRMCTYRRCSSTCVLTYYFSLVCANWPSYRIEFVLLKLLTDTALK